MTRSFQPALTCLFLAVALAPRTRAQAVPNVQGASSYQGFRLPTVGGTMSYSLTLSGGASKGAYGTRDLSGFTSVSGNLALLTTSQRHPFSMVYSGGYFASVTGDAPSTVFQNLSLSQVLTFKRWTYTVADSISYLPQTATTGLSGVPGVGDTGTPPVDVGTGTDQGVLTYAQSRVSNSAIGSAQRRLTASTSFSGTGSYAISRFLDSGASATSPLSSDQYGAGLNVSHRIDARNTAGASYFYSESSYPSTADPLLQNALGLVSSFKANSFTLNYARLINRRLSFNIAAGPQLTSISQSAAVAGVSGTGTSVNATVSTGLSYTARAGAATLSYVRGTNTGSGVVSGASTDSVQTMINRRLSRVWYGSASVAYSRSSSLVVLSSNPFQANTLVATMQVSRSLGRHLSTYGSYTAQRQSTQGQTASAAYSGLNQTIAAGLTYSPGVIGRRRR